MSLRLVADCDDKCFEVVAVHPVTYRLWAPDEETAKRRAAILRPEIKDEGVCVGFPDSISVKEVNLNA